MNGMVTRSPVERHADALAEMQRLTEEHAALRQQAEDDHREKLRLQDQIVYMRELLEESRQNERVLARKLIRLTTAFAAFGTMADMARDVLTSVQDWQNEDKPDDGAAAVIKAIGVIHQEPE